MVGLNLTFVIKNGPSQFCSMALVRLKKRRELSPFVHIILAPPGDHYLYNTNSCPCKAVVILKPVKKISVSSPDAAWNYQTGSKLQKALTITRYSNPQHFDLDLYDRCEIWQASRCRPCGSQFSKSILNNSPGLHPWWSQNMIYVTLTITNK